MKLITTIALSLISISSFAKSYTCQDTSIGSTDIIQIDIHHGDVFISERDEYDSEILLRITSEDMEGNFSAELTEYYGYTRSIIKEGDSISIDFHDECSGSTARLNCTGL